VQDEIPQSAEDLIEKRNISQQDFGWEVPVSTVPVPSQGLVYPKDSTLYGKETVHIKAMTAREEDILTSRALIRQGTVITHLLNSCLTDKSIDVDDMLLGDRNALMVAVRITGYGSHYPASVVCPACETQAEYDFDLAELEIKRLSIAPVSEGQNSFEFVLPVSNKLVHFRFMTGHDERELTTTAERKKKIMPDSKLESLVTARLEFVIQSIDGVTDRNKINMFVQNMPALDSRKLRSYMENNEPGINMNSWMECQQCGETSQVPLPVGTGFFWPQS
tara:strand:+ start:1576 stop:2406 length:831 start_codon:yes stop_codon:yes gene_type:complete